jgi:transcriptional regulator with XRE-family HTH domain
MKSAGVPAAMPAESPLKPAGGDVRVIGARLRALRGERSLTILELAAKAGVSAGMISQIERGNANPSVKTMQRLSTALDVNLWQFLDEPKPRLTNDEAPFVRRRDQRPRLVLGSTGLVKELLSPQFAENLRFMFVSMKPGSFTEEVLIAPGQKAGYVVSGSVQLTVGDHVVVLEEGDSFQFNSDVAHRLDNHSFEDAKVLWIMSALDNRL